MTSIFNKWLTATIGADLDDAFQFTKPDGSRHSYVTREWVEDLIARAVAAAAADERIRCAKLADELGVRYLYITPAVQGSGYMPACEVRPFSARIHEVP